MLITSPRGSIIEKVFIDAQGRTVRARLFVYESAGRLKARVLEAVFVESLPQGVWILSAPQVIAVIPKAVKQIGKAIVSPYFVNCKEFLYCLGLKPRAPTV